MAGLCSNHQQGLLLLALVVCCPSLVTFNQSKALQTMLTWSASHKVEVAAGVRAKPFQEDETRTQGQHALSACASLQGAHQQQYEVTRVMSKCLQEQQPFLRAQTGALCMLTCLTPRPRQADHQLHADHIAQPSNYHIRDRSHTTVLADPSRVRSS